jgi:hypothetical protein
MGAWTYTAAAGISAGRTGLVAGRKVAPSMPLGRGRGRRGREGVASRYRDRTGRAPSDAFTLGLKVHSRSSASSSGVSALGGAADSTPPTPAPSLSPLPP